MEFQKSLLLCKSPKMNSKTTIPTLTIPEPFQLALGSISKFRRAVFSRFLCSLGFR